jgi:membrane protein DedA with SNARE-associated domain
MFDSITSFLNTLTSAVSPENPLGFLGVFLVAALVDVGFPIPFIIESLLFFSTYQNGIISAQVWLIVLTGMAGRVAGSGFLYLLSRYLGDSFLNWLAAHFHRLADKIEKLKSELEKHVVISVVTVSLTPGLRQAPALATGAMRLSFPRFAIGIALASLIYDTLVILLAFLARLGLQRISSEPTPYIFLALLITMGLMWVITYFTFRQKQERPQ